MVTFNPLDISYVRCTVKASVNSNERGAAHKV